MTDQFDELIDINTDDVSNLTNEIIKLNDENTSLRNAITKMYDCIVLMKKEYDSDMILIIEENILLKQRIIELENKSLINIMTDKLSDIFS